jgi:hypothetical protein
MAAVEQNQGFAAGIAQRSKVQRLAWALKGAQKLRKKDLKLNALAAIAEGRKLRDKVTLLMTEAHADPMNAMVFCVFAEPDLSALVPELAYLPPGDDSKDMGRLKKNAEKLPIGFLVFVRDTQDPKKPIFGHARPLIVEDPRGPLLNELALHSYTRKIEAKLTSDGLIPDKRNWNKKT